MASGAAVAGSAIASQHFVSLLKSCAVAVVTLSCAVDESGANVPLVAPSPTSGANFAVEPAPAVNTSNRGGRVRALEVAGFEPALLFTPVGDAQRPLVIAAHGAGGGPEWECEYWQRLTRGRAFILCLSGTRLGAGNTGFYFRDHRALDRELSAAEQAARASEPRILAGSGIYAGFSQGATMGTAIIALHARAFPYGVLIEGFMSWNVPGARQFKRAGGRRLLIACGSKECANVGKTSTHWFQVAGAEARLEYAPGAGHTPAGPVLDKIESALPWLLDGDPNWQ